ncbi:MAG: DUF1361 domain-containing protein [Alphaproteobacteria bacterium]|nr:DUF1361 domain-containing protein [Alphaproteobacteria bacterium]
MNEMHDFARRHALYATLLLGVAAIATYAGRVVHTDSWTFLFLPRNLFLGWIPVLAALGVAAASRSARAAMLPLVLLWLVFLPNSVYLLTDLVHLRSRPGVPHVYDSTMCGAFAGAGVVAGVSALSIVEEACRRVWGARWTWAMIVPTLFLNGLGVWIGRYQRWNSWDLASDPLGVVRDVWTPLVAEPSLHLWAISLTYAAVLGVSWLAFVSLRPPAQASAAHMPRAQRDPAASAP